MCIRYIIRREKNCAAQKISGPILYLEVILLRGHVLLMGFLGRDAWPAPRLADVQISRSKARELYWNLALTVRKIYHVCKLVHGDLSEFNLLYFDETAYVIDVSQSVEHDHPNALDFLRKDLTNVTAFFGKKNNVDNVLTVKELFDFVVDPTLDDPEAELERLSEMASEREPLTAEELISEEVFKRIYIPRKLDEVAAAQRDIDDLKSGVKSDVSYRSVTGVQLLPSLDHNDDDDNEDESDDGDESEDDDESEGEESKSGFKSSRRPKEESLESKKERKKAVKAEQAEKRKHKIKKHVKKKKERANSKK